MEAVEQEGILEAVVEILHFRWVTLVMVLQMMVAVLEVRMLGHLILVMEVRQMPTPEWWYCVMLPIQP
jgi:hypothetical protein